jgi:hypothetical protein
MTSCHAPKVTVMATRAAMRPSGEGLAERIKQTVRRTW